MQVLRLTLVEDRVALLTFLCEVAAVSQNGNKSRASSDASQECLAMNNFSAAFAMWSAFNAAPITRLTATWQVGVTSACTPRTDRSRQHLSARTQKQLRALSTLFAADKDYARYRQCLARATPPLIPYVHCCLPCTRLIGA